MSDLPLRNGNITAFGVMNLVLGLVFCAAGPVGLFVFLPGWGIRDGRERWDHEYEFAACLLALLGLSSMASGIAIAARRTWAPRMTAAAGCVWLVAVGCMLSVAEAFPPALLILVYGCACLSVVCGRRNRHEFGGVTEK
jgi:hypothetical protein